MRRRALRSLLVAVVLAGAAAAPASAGLIQVTPIINGSGSVTAGNAGTCTTPALANGTLTPCATASAQSGVGQVATITLSATPRATPAGHWHFARWEGNAPGCSGSTSPSCTVIAVSGGFVAFAVFTDTVGPSFGAVTMTPSTSVDRTATFAYDTPNEPLSAAECKVDGGAFASCPLTQQTLTLPEGSHTFSVRGTDLSGNVGAVPSTTTFKVVDTALVDGPADFSNTQTPAFTFSTGAGTAFECRIDDASFAACGTPGADGRASKQLAALTEGVHTFRVRATDTDAGAVDTVPLTRTWTIDTTAPTVAFIPGSGPGDGALQVSDHEAFGFASDDPNAALECRLDDAAFTPCASGILLEHLTTGGHHFEVRAIDRAGNVSAAAARSWAVAAQDRDGDGVSETLDCNDANAAIRPGAAEVPGNAVDENCDGIAAPGAGGGGGASSSAAKVVASSRAGRRTTTFTSLRVTGITSGSTVTVTCKGRGCPKALKGKGYTKRRVSGSLSLTKVVSKPLRAGDVLTVAVAPPKGKRVVTTVTVRAGKPPLIARKG